MGSSDIDLSALLARPGFRADMLYFLRMAGSYIETIFLDARANWKGNRRLEFQTAIDDKIEAEPNTATFFASLRMKQPPIEFAFTLNFGLLLVDLPASLKDNIARRLLWEHALPWNFRTFDQSVEQLRLYRNYLEHRGDFEKRGESRPADADILKLLGLLLLPHLHNHLVGRVIHHERKLGIRQRQTSEAVRAILGEAESDRREASRNLFGLKTRGTLPKGERKDRETYNDRWKARFPLWFADDCWPRYNEHNFKTRYHFIGPERLKTLGTALQGEPPKAGYFADPARTDFIREIEPLYYATLDINLILHKFLAELEAQGVKVRDRKKVSPLIPALRNEIAHGGFFWTVKETKDAVVPCAPQKIFAAVLALPEQARLNDIKQRRNDLATAIAAVLQDYSGHRVHDATKVGDNPNQQPPPLVVHRWTMEKRARYADRSRFRIDRRPRLRTVLAGWKRALDNALSEKN